MSTSERSVDPRTAHETVFDNLELDESDLGLDAGDLGDEGGDDLGDDNDASTQRVRGQDDGRVTHRPNGSQLNTQPRQQQQQRSQDRRQPQFQDRRQPLPRGAEVQADPRGNLVDAQGNVIARAGMEARLYQDAHRSRAALSQAQRQNTDLDSRLRRAVELGQGAYRQLEQLQARVTQRDQEIQRAGLSPQEFTEALAVASLMKANPVDGIKRILTMAASRGVDLRSLGVQGNGGIDMKAITDLIRSEVQNAAAPIKTFADTQAAADRQREEDTRNLREAETEVNSFLNLNPDARQYIPVIHEVLSKPEFANMSLGEVWAHIQRNLMIMQMRGNQRNGNGNPPSRRGIPQGRQQPARQPDNGGMAPISMSYDAILREVLDTEGY